MCDGLFLIEDTAKHNGFEPDPKEVMDHIFGCEECLAEVENMIGDEDEPVPFWPDDDYLASYVEPDRLEDLGHA